MEKKIVRYKCGETNCQGLFFYNEIVQESRPGVVIAPAFRGLDEFARNKGEELAKLGYTVFVADLYGNGIGIEVFNSASNSVIKNNIVTQV